VQQKGISIDFAHETVMSPWLWGQEERHLILFHA